MPDPAYQRDNGYRSQLPVLPDAGFHFSWLGGPEAIERKCSRSCHLEIRDKVLAGNRQGFWYEQGFSLRDERLMPVDVDDTWPRYIRERRCPPEWFRPRAA